MDDTLSLVPYRVKMSPEQLIRFHVIFYTFMNDIVLTKSELNALTLLGLRGKPTLSEFCNELVSRKVYLSQYSARNAISDLCEDKELVTKEGKRSKVISLDQRIQVIGGPSVLSIICVADGK